MADITDQKFVRALSPEHCNLKQGIVTIFVMPRRPRGGIYDILYTMDMQENNLPELGSLGSFDFTPEWARRDAGVSVGNVRPERPADSRPPKNDRKPPFRRDAARPRDAGRPHGDARVERRPRLELEVKVLPEPKALGTMIRKIQQDFHAYKLKDLAYFLLDNPGSVLLKISPAKNDSGARPFHQCKACSFASTNEQEVADHILSAHLGDYYEAKEIECEPPKGNFNCVAKCGLTGVLLGPPNIHEFNSTVKEMIRTKFPDMSEADYRSRIEMVRDADAIEEWRKGATKKTVFVPKAGGADAVPVTREQAEAELRRNILPSMLDNPKQLMITAEAALKSPVREIVWAAKDVIEAEKRIPAAMCFALRGAFHHRKMHFFRANDARGQEFVTSVEYKTFDAEHAIAELAKLARFIEEHPCQPKTVIAPDAESEKHLVWLVSTGHVVAFTNGVYSAVEKYPKYGPQWQKKYSPKKEEPENKEESGNEDTPKLAE